jgi:hypothetical protein
VTATTTGRCRAILRSHAEGVQGARRLLRTAGCWSGAVTVLALVATCGGHASHAPQPAADPGAHAVPAATVPTPKPRPTDPRAAPRRAPLKPGYVGPRTVDGVRLVGLPYVTASTLTDASGSHAYGVYFRVNRPIPGYVTYLTSGAQPTVTIDGGEGQTPLDHYPGTSAPCYIAIIDGATKLGSISSAILRAGPGQVVRFALVIVPPDGPRLLANVRATRLLPSDVSHRHSDWQDQPYGRLLGCRSR